MKNEIESEQEVHAINSPQTASTNDVNSLSEGSTVSRQLVTLQDLASVTSSFATNLIEGITASLSALANITYAAHKYII